MWGGAQPSARRAVLGGLTAFGVALGGNLGGCTSWLLGLDGGKTAEKLRLDVLIPVSGHKRCVDYSLGFEFTYPVAWLADQTLLYRAAQRAEEERGLDLPALAVRRQRRRQVVEPAAAFGPAGTTGETNVSVIVAPIFDGFSLESMGTPSQVASQFLRTIAPEGSGKEVQLLASGRREDSDSGQLYYLFEYTVRGPTFNRHNLSVVAGRGTQLYTFNAQTPQPLWDELSDALRGSAASFHLIQLAKPRFGPTSPTL